MQTLARAKYSRVRGDVKASEYVQLIQRDSDICNNCFRLTHVTEERNYVVDTYRDGNESKIWLRQVERPDRSWPRLDETEYMLSDTMTGGTYRGCKCGISHTTIRPVTKERAMDHLERLMNRLDEKEFDFDRNVLRQAAWSLFTSPDMQGKQDEAFARVVAEAV